MMLNRRTLLALAVSAFASSVSVLSLADDIEIQELNYIQHPETEEKTNDNTSPFGAMSEELMKSKEAYLNNQKIVISKPYTILHPRYRNPHTQKTFML